MTFHLILMGGVALVGTMLVAAYIFTKSREQQYGSQYNSISDYPTDIDRSVIGPCGICSGNVSALDGYQAPCNHFVHYTCAASLTTDLRNVKIIWKKVCKMCLKACTNGNQRQQRESLRYRASPQQKCANCQLEFEDDQDRRAFECNHYVHTTCWERMQNTAFSECPICT